MRTKPLDTFDAEPEERVDVSGFVISAKQVNILRVLNLRRAERSQPRYCQKQRWIEA